MNLPHIQDVDNLKGQVVLVRIDVNVPLGDDGVVDPNESWRIQKSMRTLAYLREQEARVVVIAHIGREPNESLKPIVEYMVGECDFDIGFLPYLLGETVQNTIEHLGHGQVVMLENLRSDSREKDNDESLAQELASQADLYVNDAFSVAHREHASIASIPNFLPSYIGFQFADEVAHLEHIRNPEHPLVLVMGGAKFGTKLQVMEEFLDTADSIFVGGALGNRLYKEQGYEIGRSVTDDEPSVGHLTESNTIHLSDMVTTEKGTKSINEVTPEDSIMDIDITGFHELNDSLDEAKTILWNGPMGYYEGGYTDGTTALAHILAEHDEATTIVGGGDTVTVLYNEGVLEDYNFVSTAGGAMLEYLAGEKLPGIQKLKENQG